MQDLRTKIEQLLRRFHKNDSGAVIVLCLAAFMIITLLSLVIWDSIQSTGEKVHLQTSTDAAAYSQAVVQARTMNMLALSNVGKRMTVGMLTAYINVNQWMQAIKDYAAIIAAVCALVSAGGAAAICGQAAVGAHQAHAREGRDRGKIYSKSRKCALRIRVLGVNKCLIRWPALLEYGAPDYGSLEQLLANVGSLGIFNLPGGVVRLPDDIYDWKPQRMVGNFYGRELQAFDNYQKYMTGIAPYWAWTEGVVQGIENHAPITVSYPTPKSSPHTTALPVQKSSWDEICNRAQDNDRTFIFADYVLKNLAQAIGGGNINVGSLASNAGQYGSILLAGVFMAFIDKINKPLAALAPRVFRDTCKDVTGLLLAKASSTNSIWPWGPRTSNFKEFGRPYRINQYQNQNDWLMATSNLTFGFRPNASKMDDGKGRKKYKIVGKDYLTLQPKAGGTWVMSRSEFAFQQLNQAPNLWAPQWTARIRPVALPDEWHNPNGNSSFNLNKAFEESLPELSHVTGVAHMLNSTTSRKMITHPYTNAWQIAYDLAAMEKATRGLTNETMQGVTK